MSETGLASVWAGPYRIEKRRFPVPSVDGDGVLLETGAASVCGTDRHLYKQSPPYPVILGHEIAGKVVAMGKNARQSMKVFNASGLGIGDRVVIFPWIPCGRCWGCLKFKPGAMTCTNGYVYGMPFEILDIGDPLYDSNCELAPHFKGGFGEYVYLRPGTYMWKLPEDMPWDVASLLDPTGVALRAVELSQTCPGIMEEGLSYDSTVCILGSGPVGLLVAIACREAGVERIILTGRRRFKLTLAEELGLADYTMSAEDFSAEDRVRRVREITDGHGADVVFECVGTPDAFVEAVEAVRRLGTVVEVGNTVTPGQKVGIDPCRQICIKNIRLLGLGANPPRTFDKAFSLLKRYKRIPFARLITHHFTIGELDRALEVAEREEAIKITLLGPGAE